MKMKRLLASVLALLLVVSILPIGALAEDIVDPVSENDKEIGTNYSTIDKNTGTVDKNYSWEHSGWNINENGTEGGGRNSGTVNTNSGKINNNYGTVKINDGGTPGSYQPTVNNNYGLVKENNGIVINNWGKGEVTINNGSVGLDKYGYIVAGAGNYGTIGTNNGTINVNEGTVGKVNEAGHVVEGYGNFGTVNTNTGNIILNCNQVGTNEEGGTIHDNSGNVDTNEAGAEIAENFGTIENNSGVVGNNHDKQCKYDGADREMLDGTPSVVDKNSGTVIDNEGTVNNIQNGKVLTNTGTVNNGAGGVVEANEGLVNNEAGGEVKENYGLVNNEAGGLLNDMILSKGELAPKSEYKQFKGEEGTYVGTWVERGSIKTEDGKTEEFQGGGVMTVLKQAIQGAVLDLKEVGKLFQIDGYEVIGYTTEKDESEEDPNVPAEAFMALDDGNDKVEFVVVDSPDYKVKESGGWLSLIWQKITGKKPAAPSAPSNEPETKTVQNNIPTSLSAGQVKVGAYVRRGNLLFRIIEVTDNDIRVATVGKLSEKSLADMMGFLKQHLSDAQIAKIIGEPALLEQELVTYFFGDSYEHIAFRAARDLFA